MGKFTKKALLITLALVFSLLVAEGISRAVFDPIDFLKPSRVPDDILRYKLAPGTGAHDRWGFRNRSVPIKADVVAIGDSHTYGISATAKDSWPAQLAALTNKTVYNLSLGGWGPAEYLYLLEDKALELKPDLIVVGLYLGNDLKDAFDAVYGVEHWRDMRDREIEQGLKNNPNENRTLTEKPKLGEFLSSHSVFYRLVSSSPIGDSLRQQRRLSRGEDIVMYSHEELGINTGFTPGDRLRGVDLETQEVKEGLRLTLDFLDRMNEIAKKRDTELLIVIIPTKESVYSDYIKKDDLLAGREKILEVALLEEKLNSRIQDFLINNRIAFIDTLPLLKGAAATEQIYPNNFGGHTNKNGYRALSEALVSYLKENPKH